MSLKRLLGLDGFPIREEEIMQQIREAYLRQKSEIVFSSPSRKVKVKLSSVSPLGMMREYQDYYAK